MAERFTRRQKEIIDLILTGDGSGGWIDIDELILKIGDPGSKQATQCSIRILETRGYVEREYGTRRGRKRMVLKPTPSAYTTFRGASLLGP